MPGSKPRAESRAAKEEEAEFFQIADGDMRSWEERQELSPSFGMLSASLAYLQKGRARPPARVG